jgi:hypothetical protein
MTCSPEFQPVITLVHLLEMEDSAALAARGCDNLTRQGEFLFVNRSSELSKDNRWC